MCNPTHSLSDCSNFSKEIIIGFIILVINKETMNDIQIRFLLFLFGCIGTRLAFTFLAKIISLQYLPYLGYLALVLAIGFLMIYGFGLRKTGVEVLGNRIWWNELRPIHGLLYGLFSYLAITRNPNAWIVLLTDTAFGFVSFIKHHYLVGNFKYLF